MKKVYLVLLIMSNINFANAQNCNYSIELFDSYGDGWTGNEVIVSVDGNPVDTITLTSGAGPEGYYLNVDTNAVIDIVFYSIGSDPAECTFELYDCKSQNVGSGDNTTNISAVIVNCNNCMSGDCENSEQICDNTTINSNPNGSGYNDDLNAGNWGTLILGEHFANWLHFQAAVDCEICFTISNTNQIDYDFAIWDGVECPPNTQPLRCSYARKAAGLGDSEYDTGMQNSDLCTWETDVNDICGITSDGFTSCINAVAGQKFTMLVDNWDGISTPFTLTWSFDVPDPLNCNPISLPVEFITSSFNCLEQSINWTTVSEINNDYFTIKVGKSYSNNELIVDDEYIVYGNGNSNQVINYKQHLDISS